MECFHFHTLRRPRFLREAFLVSVLISLIVSQLLCVRAYVCVCVCVCLCVSVCAYELPISFDLCY